MKNLKIFGLAAIAALGLMAFMGAGAASATTLSTDSAGTIKYAVGTELAGSLASQGSGILADTSGNTIATCTALTIKGTIGTATGTWVSGNISTLAWEGCSQTTDTVSNGSLEIMQTTGDEGTVVGRGTNVTIQIFGVSCTYGTGEGTTLGTVTGGESPMALITGPISKTAGGFLCPSTAIWHAQAILTTPHAVHITA